MTRLPASARSGAPPRLSNCRTLDIGISGYVECLCSGPNPCHYVMPFGYSFLCNHPRLLEMAERTKANSSPPMGKPQQA